jgi:hypothetical protein
MNRQALRSIAVACTNRGNQVKGTERLRPSLSSTVNVSFLTVTDSAVGTATLIAKVFMPGLSKAILVKVDDFLDSIQFRPRKTAAFLEPDWIKPKLRNIVLTLNMYMRWLIALNGYKALRV